MGDVIFGLAERLGPGRTRIGIGLAGAVALAAAAGGALLGAGVFSGTGAGGGGGVADGGGGGNVVYFDASALGFRLLPPGTKLPNGKQCAKRVRRSPWEPRPENAVANASIGHKVAPMEGVSATGNARLTARIHGQFTGTTDEIIQWASCKWGIDTDTVRAQAVVESDWRQDAIGDGGESFGLMQIKARFHPGTYPASLHSTAFNLDYALAHWRLCYEGYIEWIPAAARGDKWGCIGLHWSGDWGSDGALDYAARVRRALDERAWLEWPGQQAA